MAKVVVLSEYCKSCGLCVAICPRKVLVIGDKPNKKGYFAAVAAAGTKCTACTLCGLVCPDVAIEVYK